VQRSRGSEGGEERRKGTGGNGKKRVEKIRKERSIKEKRRED
jgi:hypothetical protein